jgi:uncharacterized protein
VTETPFFLQRGPHSLFAILHDPAVATKLPFVFCHAFVEEKLWAQRVFVTFARALAAQGHPVLRIDYLGNGDSDGSFEDSSVETARADIDAAIDLLRQRTGATGVGLLGLRFGATMAGLVAEERTDVERLVLWAPVVDGARYMQELLRINLTTQMAVYKEIRHDREALAAAMAQGRTVNVDGYELAQAMFTQASAVKLAAAPKRYARPCLIVHVDRQPDRPVPELAQLAQSYPACTLAAVQEEPFWKEILRFYQQAPNLFATTLTWLAADGVPAAPAAPAAIAPA